MGAFLIGKVRIYIVADGMGGHNSGDLAAELTVEGIREFLAQTLPKMPVTDAIRNALQSVNARVYKAAHAGDPTSEGMGSTVVLLATMGRLAYIAHVGDSRAYLYRNGILTPLTRDHSLVQDMVDSGVLTPEEARNHPHSNVINRAIGNESEVEVTLKGPLPLRSGDGFLLCSDGLCGYVEDGEIEAVLRGDCSVQEVADNLVVLALRAGGLDNVTVQFIQYGKRSEARAKKMPEKCKSGIRQTQEMKQD